MNHDIFCKWFSERLIPNIPNNSLIIMDNAPYHNSLAANSPPNISSKKTEIKVWLEQYGIPIKDNCLKAELIEILQKIGPKWDKNQSKVDVGSHPKACSVFWGTLTHPKLTF